MVNNYASLFDCTPVGIRLNDEPNIKPFDVFKLVGTGLSHVYCLGIRGSTGGFLLLRF